MAVGFICTWVDEFQIYCDGLGLAAEVSVTITNGHRRRRRTIVSSVIPISKSHFPARSINPGCVPYPTPPCQCIRPISCPVRGHYQFQRSCISPTFWWFGRILFLSPARQWGSDSRLACLQSRLEVLLYRKNHGIEVLNYGHCVIQVSRDNQ